MKRLPLILMALCLYLSAPLWAQEPERRLVRLESRLYGWYAVADPSFDKTIGRRELFKIAGRDQFLKGLAGRLVVIEGVFEDGTLILAPLAPPPVSVDEGVIRQRVIARAEQGSIKTESGLLLDGELPYLEEGRWQLDLVGTPSGRGAELAIVEVLQAKNLTWEPARLEPAGDLDTPPLIDLSVTQDLLDDLTRVALTKVDLSTTYQGLTLDLSRLRLQLPEGASSVKQPWSLQGSVELSFGGSTSLAETSFVVDASPVIEQNTLKLKPDWQAMRIEGQLPFSFALGGKDLGKYASYLPEKITLLNLDLVNTELSKRDLIPPDSGAQWYLGTPAPGSFRVLLAEENATLPAGESLEPGTFRLLLGRSLVDRMVAQQVERHLHPDSPFRPDPPIEVGKALFIPIEVNEIYVRDLKAGYQRGALRFQDLTIDVGWKAGPLSGLEPLFRTTGYVVPKLMTNTANPHLSWDVRIEELEIRSDKLPGDKEQLIKEFEPKIENALGPELAEKTSVSNRIPLNKLGLSGDTVLVITQLRPLDASLTLSGRVETSN